MTQTIAFVVLVMILLIIAVCGVVIWAIQIKALRTDGRAEKRTRAAPPPSERPACGGCGGPHPFDTSIPSVKWNQVIRAAGGSEYLCLTCIVSAFAKAGESFTAVLSGAELHGVSVEFRVDGKVANDARLVQEENNRLRWELGRLERERKEST